jgi:hypothetical protein
MGLHKKTPYERVMIFVLPAIIVAIILWIVLLSKNDKAISWGSSYQIDIMDVIGILLLSFFRYTVRFGDCLDFSMNEMVFGTLLGIAGLIVLYFNSGFLGLLG